MLTVESSVIIEAIKGAFDNHSVQMSVSKLG